MSEEQNEIERKDQTAPGDQADIPGGKAGFALDLARALMLVICLSLAALSIFGAIMALGSRQIVMIVVVELFVAGQITGLVFAYRRARRSGRASLIVAGGVLVVILWIMSIGLCNVSTQSLDVSTQSLGGP